MKNKTLYEVARENVRANSIIMNYIQDVHDAFERQFQRDIALQNALTPSDKFLERQANIIEEMLKKMGIAEELAELTKIHNEEASRILKNCDVIISVQEKADADLD